MIGLSGICLHALFTTGYVGLVVTVAWELRMKLSNKAARILQANNKTSTQAKVLVLNLFQLLLCCGLVSTIKIVKTSPAPGRDYVLGCLLLLLLKLLHLKRETFLPDLVGLTSLATTALVCHQHVSSPTSLLETASSLVNLIVFCGPPPVILAFLIMTPHLTLSTTVALICLLCILLLLQQGRFKLLIIPFLLLLLQFTSKYQDPPTAQNIINDSDSQTLTGGDQPLENINFGVSKCENSLTDPVKYFTFKPPAFNETERESRTSPSKVPQKKEEEEEEERQCSELKRSSKRELTVLSSEERAGRCEVFAVDLTGRAALTKHLLHLTSLLLPSLSLAPTLSLTLSLRALAAPVRCSNLPGAQIVSHLQNNSHLSCQEEIIFKQNSLSTQIFSFLINVKNSLMEQFL